MSNEIVGNYTIYKNYKNKLGKGSYSSVYKGVYTGPTNEYINNGDIVAIKIINTSNLSYSDYEITNNEVKIMNMLKLNPHPNIVKCLDTIQTQKNTYIIMELCECGDLQSIMNKPIEEKYVRAYFIQLIAGLKYLHNYKLIHRDIKPKNILLSNNRKILKIADFGFAKIIKTPLLKEKICGSPLYMAPEIMNNDVYNNQADLWSVGIILYEMIYGIHPYKHCQSFGELKEEINVTNIKVPPDNCKNIIMSNDCVMLLQKLLQKHINLRITWIDFFENTWTNKIVEDVNFDDMMDNDDLINYNDGFDNINFKKITKTNNVNIPVLNTPNSYEITSSTPENAMKIMCSNINIIDDYYSIEYNSPIVKVNNQLTNSCIFDMDFGDEVVHVKHNIY